MAYIIDSLLMQPMRNFRKFRSSSLKSGSFFWARHKRESTLYWEVLEQEEERLRKDRREERLIEERSSWKFG